MIDRHAEVRHSEQGVARNVLQLERLGRVDLRTKLSCHASNTQLSQPLTKSVEIELNRKSTQTLFLLFTRCVCVMVDTLLVVGVIRRENSCDKTNKQKVAGPRKKIPEGNWTLLERCRSSLKGDLPGLLLCDKFRH